MTIVQLKQTPVIPVGLKCIDQDIIHITLPQNQLQVYCNNVTNSNIYLDGIAK